MFKQKKLLGTVLTALSVLIQPWLGLVALAQAPTDAVQEYTLPSGQKVYIKEDHDQPIVTMDTWVTTGSVNETADNNGVSHFLEHLIFKGTDQYKTGEIDRLLESKGSKFNAATSDDYTHYYITTATPFFEEALKLHASMLNRATIPQAELDRERKVVQEEINRATDNPDHKRFDALSKMLYPNHGYGLDTLGPKENIANIPREKILAYYQYWYQPKNFNTVITGDIQPEQALALVKKYFSQSPDGQGATALTQQAAAYQPPAVQRPEAGKEIKVKVIEDPSVSQAYLTLGFPGPSITEREDLFALDVAMLALGSGKSSRLYQTLHEQKPLVTSVGAGNLTQKYSGLLFVDAEMKPENRQTVKNEIVQQLNALKEKGITAEELAKAKTQTLKEFTFHNETTDGVAGSIGYNVTIGTLQDYTDYVANVQKVTQSDVKRALNRYLNFNNAVLVELLPPGQGSVSQLEAGNRQWLAQAANPGAAASKPVTQKPAAKTPAQSAAPTAPEVKQPAAVVKATPTKTVLSNGMTLLSKPVRDSQTVAIKFFVKGGQSVEPVPGLASLTAPLLMSGTAERTAEAISKELESRGMKLSVAANEDYIEVSGSSVAEDFGELFIVIQDVMNHPTFLPEEIEKQKAHLKQAIVASRDNPSALAMENLSMALYPNHPYGNVGKRIEPHLSALTREQIQRFYETFFVPSNMVVSVVGNFDPQTVTNYLLSAFPNSLNSRARATGLAKAAPAVSPLPKDEVVEEKKPIKGATWIVQGWLAPSIDSEKDYVAMKVLNSFLGSGMSSRLFVNLREKQGLAYVVSSAYPTLADESNFFLFIGTDPRNRQTVIDGFKKEIERLKTEPLDPQELQEAKDKLRGAFALAHETNNSQAFYLGFYETLGVSYRFDETYPEKIQQVTAEDIRRVATQYFSQPSVLSIVSPQDTVAEPKAAAPAPSQKATQKKK